MRAAVALDKIGNDVCIALGDTHFNHKIVVIGHLVDCYRNFNLYASSDQVIKTEVFEYGNTIHLPSNFIYETKVGVMVNGRIAILTVNNNQDFDNVTHDKCSDRESRNYMSSIWDGDYNGDGFYFYNVGGGYGELYGQGRGIKNRSTYGINRKEGIIELGSNIPKGSKIVIEYMADKISDDGLKLIPVELKKMHEYYALAEMYMGSKFSNITKSQISNNKYELEYKKAKRLYNQSDPSALIDSINASFSPTNY